MAKQSKKQEGSAPVEGEKDPKNQLPDGSVEVFQNTEDGLPEGTEPTNGEFVSSPNSPRENQQTSVEKDDNLDLDFLQPDTAIKARKAQEEKGEKYTVAKGKSFRDRDDWSKEYKEGDDISQLSQERKDYLVEIGYAKKG